MPFDNFVTGAVARELDSLLAGGKVERVYQPDRYEVVLHVNVPPQGAAARAHRDLLISAQGSHPYIYITEKQSPNPQAPPAFCMLLRKHLIGARVERVFRVGRERIIRIDFDAADVLGVRGRKTLVFEIMGKHSNIIMLDGTDTVLDSSKRVYPDMSRVRQTLPGIAYTPPPPGKGIGPLMEAEIEDGKPLSHYEALDSEGRYEPRIVYSEDGTVKDFYVFAVSAYAGLRSEPCPSVSAMIEKYYGEKEIGNRMAQKSADLRQKLKSDLDKLYLKKQRLREDIEKAGRADEYRLKGELITSNIYRLKQGMKEAELEDYSALATIAAESDGTKIATPATEELTAPVPEELAATAAEELATPAPDEIAAPAIRIALDPMLTPAQNAQRYFKKYAKAKTAVTEKAKQLDITERDISFLESYSVFLAGAEDVADIDGIREELSELGYMKRGGRNAKTKRSVKKKYLRYESRSGHPIYVGRNNRENDELTLKKAKPDDLWLHTKDIPGSHVILAKRPGQGAGGGHAAEEPYERNQKAGSAAQAALPAGFDEEAVRTAARIAAHYSKARQSESVPVDYCLVKYVKKPAGAKPGMVIFTHNRTLYVTPELP